MEEGDQIAIDIPACKIELLVDGDTLAKRKAAWTPHPPRCQEGVLGLYTGSAASPMLGGYMDNQIVQGEETR